MFPVQFGRISTPLWGRFAANQIGYAYVRQRARWTVYLDRNSATLSKLPPLTGNRHARRPTASVRSSPWDAYGSAPIVSTRIFESACRPRSWMPRILRNTPALDVHPEKQPSSSRCNPSLVFRRDSRPVLSWDFRTRIHQVSESIRYQE